MKRKLQILIDELHRLKAEGVQTVSVSNETLEQLRKKTGTVAAPAAAPAAATSTTAAAPARRIRGDEEAARELAATLKQKDSVAKTTPAKSKRTLPPPPKVELPAGSKVEQLTALREQVLSCPTCTGSEDPKRPVIFGKGDPDAALFFLNDAPGEEEEAAGDPFAGEPGEMFTKMLQAMGLQREDIYLANIINWRPSISGGFGTRAPTAEEIDFCLPYLQAQIEIVRPKVLITLGNRAVDALIGRDSKRRLRDIRGKWLEFREIPLLPT